MLISMSISTTLKASLAGISAVILAYVFFSAWSTNRLQRTSEIALNDAITTAGPAVELTNLIKQVQLDVAQV
ncbi:hypothetical protein [Roseibium sediminicola]|uniref:Methyl-accepting chemotaxis protein n=1 Tax=Roseibium sediminicola TaxID=2933272 RepID=A0ABT0GW32_9HYPH|nr:hypothetical protein [Roseibium sp. CAU 1639]MCK7613657.1 hypothetical protein [Roseibium sp. CAU 1639]